MIKIEKVERCWNCNSENLVKNGHDNGKQKYICKDCKKYGRINATQRYTDENKEEIISAYNERMSLRGIQRQFGVARQTVANWIKKKPLG